MQSIEPKSQGLDMRVALLPISLFLATLFVGCESTSIKPSKDAQGRVPVVATNSILADWVKQVGGEQVLVTTLVPADGDPHTFEPTPRDGLTLTRAMLVFEIGLHFEAWLDDLFTASGSVAVRVAVSREITPRKAFCACHGTSEDPHVFQSVKHARSMVQVIAAELSKADPEHAELYSSRSKAYVEELESLDSEVRSLLAEVPEGNRFIVTAHNTFGYFAEDYGFEVLSLLDSLTSEAADPSAMKIGALIRRIRELKIPALFAESVTNSKLVQQVARESAVSKVEMLNSDSLGPKDTPTGTYVGMMRSNAKKIAESLR
ncbi:MAG: zinc ABC transporter substrate-binding protein [Pirellulales bacterium]